VQSVVGARPIWSAAVSAALDQGQKERSDWRPVGAVEERAIQSGAEHRTPRGHASRVKFVAARSIVMKA